MLANPGVAFLLNRFPTAPDNRPRHATAMLQMFVRCINDGIHFLERDVALYELEELPAR